MQVHVFVFAGLKAFFKPCFELQLPYNAVVKEMIGALQQQCPDSIELLGRSRVAIEEELVSDDYKLSDHDRIYILPPSSGG